MDPFHYAHIRVSGVDCLHSYFVRLSKGHVECSYRAIRQRSPSSKIWREKCAFKSYVC
jgi:hypothetical protein